MLETLTMLREAEARRRLGGAAIALTIVRPPYAALGVGSLRVLRVRERGATFEIAAGYDNYERLA